MVNGHLGLYLSTQSALYNLPHSPIFKGFFPHGFSTYSPTFTHTSNTFSGFVSFPGIFGIQTGSGRD